VVRKQLYITEGQDQALKHEAQSLGISEAELVRRAIDELLQGKTGHSVRQREALSELIGHTKCLAKNHRLPQHYLFDRETLYAEREQRQHQPTK